MKASDTVMGSETLVKYLMPLDYIPTGVYKAIEQQAEISFKAGIKEVVEWIKSLEGESGVYKITEGEYIPFYKPLILIHQWETKLKEWGI